MYTYTHLDFIYDAISSIKCFCDDGPDLCSSPEQPNGRTCG